MFSGLNGPSIVLTIICTFFTYSDAILADECIADLNRTDTSLCLDERTTNLNYDWNLTAESFALKALTCTVDSNAEVEDLVIAIDRSSHAWRSDKENEKIGSDQFSLARRLISEFGRDSDRQVALILYAGVVDCTEFDGGNIAIGTDFPCLFVPAGPVDDTDHLLRLESLMTKAEGLYAEGTSPRAGDHTIPAKAARNVLNFEGVKAGLMVMLTDGLSYYGEANDPYVYYKASNYNSAQQAIQAEFPVAGFGVLVGQPSLPTLLFDTTSASTIDTMCADLGPNSADCKGFDKNDPRSWKVNQLRPTVFLEALAGNNSVIETTGPASMDTRFSDYVANPSIAGVELIGFSLNGGDRQDLASEGSRVFVPNLPAGNNELNLYLRRGQADQTLRIAYGAKKITSELAVFEDREMQCTKTATSTLNPIDLSRLQGGAASCGVVATRELGAWHWLLIVVMPIVLLIRRVWHGLKIGQAANLITVLLASLGVVPHARGAGINALHYQPVADGVGMTQKAYGPETLSAQAGLFMDYANDVVELGGEKNKRIDSIMDDLVTAHFVASVGLHRHVSLGVHVPFVHKADVARQMDDRLVEGGQLGQPADISLSAKFRLYRYGSFNLGFMPIATIAQGDEELLLGDGAPNYGGHFLFSGTKGRFQWATSFGYIQRENPLRLTDARAETIVIRGQTVSSTGLEYKINSLVDVASNLQMKFTAGQSIDFRSNSPAEWLASVKLNPLVNLQLSTGFGTGIGKGFGAPDYRVFAGVAYLPQAPQRQAAKRQTALQARQKK